MFRHRIRTPPFGGLPGTPNSEGTLGKRRGLRIPQEDLENAAVLKEVWNNLLSLLELRLWISGRKLWINSSDAFKENRNYGFTAVVEQISC